MPTKWTSFERSEKHLEFRLEELEPGLSDPFSFPRSVPHEDLPSYDLEGYEHIEFIAIEVEGSNQWRLNLKMRSDGKKFSGMVRDEDAMYLIEFLKERA